MRYFANEYDINTVNVDAINSKIENVIESFVHWVGSLDRSRDLRIINTGEGLRFSIFLVLVRSEVLKFSLVLRFLGSI